VNGANQLGSLVGPLLEDSFSTLIKPGDFLSAKVFGRDDYDWDLTPSGLTTHRIKHFKTIHPGHHQVEDDHRRLRPAEY